MTAVSNVTIKEIKTRLEEWNSLTKKHYRVHLIASLLTVLISVITATFHKDLPDLFFKTLLCSNAFLVGSIPFFNFDSKVKNYRSAWRYLNVYRLKFEAGKCNIEDLIKAYDDAEGIIGDFPIASGNKTSKPNA